MRQIFFLTVILFISSCSSSFRNKRDNFSISNKLVEVCVNRASGSYSFINVSTGDTVIRSAAIECSVDYEYTRDRDRIKIFSKSDDNKGMTYSSLDPNRNNTIETGSTELTSGLERYIKLISKLDDENSLEICFSIYDGKSQIYISWAYHNHSEEAVQVQKVDVLHNAEAFPNSGSSDEFFILEGNGGGPHNSVKSEGDVISYNNLLIARLNHDTDQNQNLVIGGLTYNDYVKFAEIIDGNTQVISLYAEDPVGKRVDPGETYTSTDKFYVEYMSDDPFKALELYGENLKKEQNVHLDYYTFPSVCMWFLSVQHFGGDQTSTNDTPGAVKEMENAVESGFLNYSPVCIRLVPDNYEQNNQQGWWDDRHWQMYGRKERCIVEGGHYKAPYETTEKWAGKITDLGGIPITYIEPGIRSEDYAEAFPGHMLFNEPHRYILKNGERVVETHQIIGKIYGKLYQESYDYSDTGFVNHIKDVYKNLRDGGVKGSFYDYPERTFPVLGGMEDKYSTAAAHYRNVFRLADEGFGKPNYIQERNISQGSDITLGVVTSQRTQGDNNILSPRAVRSAGLRWYKNRSVVNYDMDGKAILVKGSRQDIPISKEERRTILTMSYAVTGRLLLTESFSRFSQEVLHDLSRIYPFHASELSARPIDAFVNDMPGVYDFRISDDWHQLVLYNENYESDKQISVPLNASAVYSGLELDAGGQYYVYDFWNNEFTGLYKGDESLDQLLRKGEARVLSVHRKLDHPQFISTDRHIMQGYVDLEVKPVWNEKEMVLSGVSSLIEDEPYSIIVAPNGYSVYRVSADDCQCNFVEQEDGKLLKVTFETGKTQNAEWQLEFMK